jgi:putative methyltransferase (TIGR04325 family)
LIPTDFKKLVLAVTPPFFVYVYRHLKSPHKGANYLWDGVYKNYRDIPTFGDGYNGDVWINSRTASTKSLIDALERGGSIPVTIGFRYSSLAFLTAIILQRKTTVHVLDFGEAMGKPILNLLKSLLTSDSVENFVVDNERSCESGASLSKKDSRIHFNFQLDDSIPDVDIVFVSVVLQYIQDYQATIQALAKYHPAYFLYTLLSAGEIPTYASVQRNLKGSVLPAWFFNIDELSTILTDVGYELVFRASIEEDRLDMVNFSNEHRLNHMINLLFSRQLTQGKV